MKEKHTEEELVEIVERFFDGTLDEPLRKEVEAEIKSNEEFAQFVQEQQRIRDAISFGNVVEQHKETNPDFGIDQLKGEQSRESLRELERKTLEHRLKNVEKGLHQTNFFEETHKNIKSEDSENSSQAKIISMNNTNTNKGGGSFLGKNKFLLGIAASVAILVIAWFLVPRGDSTEQIFAESTAPVEDMMTVEIDDLIASPGFSSDSQAALTSLKEAMTMYQQQKFSEAAASFEATLSANRDAFNPPKVEFYTAHAYYADGKYNKSAPLFETLSKKDGFELQEKSKWFLSLSYVKLKQNDKAKPILDELSGSKEFGNNAKAVLRKIN